MLGGTATNRAEGYSKRNSSLPSALRQTALRSQPHSAKKRKNNHDSGKPAHAAPGPHPGRARAAAPPASSHQRSRSRRLNSQGPPAPLRRTKPSLGLGLLPAGPGPPALLAARRSPRKRTMRLRTPGGTRGCSAPAASPSATQCDRSSSLVVPKVEQQAITTHRTRFLSSTSPTSTGAGGGSLTQNKVPLPSIHCTMTGMACSGEHACTRTLEILSRYTPASHIRYCAARWHV